MSTLYKIISSPVPIILLLTLPKAIQAYYIYKNREIPPYPGKMLFLPLPQQQQQQPQETSEIDEEGEEDNDDVHIEKEVKQRLYFYWHIPEKFNTKVIVLFESDIGMDSQCWIPLQTELGKYGISSFSYSRPGYPASCPLIKSNPINEEEYVSLKARQLKKLLFHCGISHFEFLFISHNQGQLILNQLEKSTMESMNDLSSGEDVQLGSMFALGPRHISVSSHLHFNTKSPMSFFFQNRFFIRGIYWWCQSGLSLLGYGLFMLFGGWMMQWKGVIWEWSLPQTWEMVDYEMKHFTKHVYQTKEVTEIRMMPPYEEIKEKILDYFQLPQ